MASYVLQISALFLVLVVSIVSSSSDSSNKLLELTDSQFNDYARQKEFLFVDFYAPWCSDSKALAPELEKTAYTLGRRSNDVVKVDCFGKGKKLCEIYNIKKWPTLKTFRHGTMTSEYQGSHHAEALLNYINGAEDMLNLNREDSVQTFVAPQVTTSTSTTSAVIPSTTTNNCVSSSSSSVPCTPARSSSPATSSSTNTSSTPSSTGTHTTSMVQDGVTLTVEKPEVVANYANQGEGMTMTPEDVVTIGPGGSVSNSGGSSSTSVTSATRASAMQSVTPSAEVINALECAKCKIMTPIQRAQSATCKTYRRNCIPNYGKTNYIVNSSTENNVDTEKFDKRNLNDVQHKGQVRERRRVLYTKHTQKR